MDRIPKPAGERARCERRISRRVVLQSGLFASGAAFLAACGCGDPIGVHGPERRRQQCGGRPAPPPAAHAPSASATPVAEDFSGVTLHNFTGGYMIPWLDAGTAAWKAATGGDATQDNVDFAAEADQAGRHHRDAGPVLRHDVHDVRVRVHPEVRRAPAAAGHVGRRRLTARTSATSSTNAKAALTTADGVAAGPAAVRHPAVWSWNKKLFTKIGEDPENPPDNYPDLFKLVAEVQGGGHHPVASSPGWPRRPTCSRSCYFTYIWNSTGMPMFSPDFTQIGFDNDDGQARSSRSSRRGSRAGSGTPST